MRRLLVAATLVVCAAVVSPATASGVDTEQEGRAGAALVDVVTFNMMREGAGGPLWTTRRAAAVRLIRGLGPDVLVVQEGGGGRSADGTGPAADLMRSQGMTVVTHGRRRSTGQGRPILSGAMMIGYRSSRFSLARAGVIELPRVGGAAAGGAQWALLAARADGAQMLVVDVHLPAGRSTSRDRLRASYSRKVVRAVKSIRPSGAALVVAGDFNTRAGGARKDAPTRVMRKAKLVDSIALADRKVRARLNTFNGLKRRARTTGHHLDHIWVARGTSVESWRQAARVRNGRYVGRLASDHNPIAARISLRR